MNHPSHWAAAARPGDIAMFRFPLGESEAEPKARPCLIIAARTEGSEIRLTVAYGTSAPTDANRGHDLILADATEAAQACLHRPSRFVLARRMTVSGRDARFACDRHGTAVVGTLPPRLLGPMRTLVRRLGAALTRDSRRGDPPRRSSLACPRIIAPPGLPGQRAGTVIEERRRRA